jgi:WD40 repeat protein
VKRIRTIPTKPSHTLELEGIPSDFYVSPFDWSNRNLIAFALADAVVLINPKTMELIEPDNCPVGATSLRFNPRGDSLFLGLEGGDAAVFDLTILEPISTIDLFETEILVADWKDDVVVCGSREGEVAIVDMRGESETQMTNAHLEEVCAIKIHPDGHTFATCGNDCAVKIWDMRNLGSAEPAVTYSEHNAAIRAIAWSPMTRNLLVTGGGTADKTIKIWDSTTGETVKSIDTGSQVCNLYWNLDYNEILSTHGFSQNHLALWKGTDLSPIGSIHHHKQRVLFLCVSPDGSLAATAAPGDNMQIWKMFPPQSPSAAQSLLLLR